MGKVNLLEDSVAGRILRVEIGPHDGRVVLSIGQHRERDGRGVWLNVDARDLPKLISALEQARELASGSAVAVP